MDRAVKHTPADTKPAPGYDQTRARVEDYFDRSATKTWERLTSDAPVSRIRETVRKGRDQMRALMLSRLPDDLRGARILDAGCGPGMATIELAKRGAEVKAAHLVIRAVKGHGDRIFQDDTGPEFLRNRILRVMGQANLGIAAASLGCWCAPIGARGLQHMEGAHNIGFNERPRPVDRPVHMAFCREVHHRVGFVCGKDLIKACTITDVRLFKGVKWRVRDGFHILKTGCIG